MNLNLLLGCNALLNEEECDVLPEVSLQLDNQTLLFILDYCPVAMEHFLESAQELFVVQVVWETLDNGDALAGSTLLVM